MVLGDKRRIQSVGSCIAEDDSSALLWRNVSLSGATFLGMTRHLLCLAREQRSKVSQGKSGSTRKKRRRQRPRLRERRGTDKRRNTDKWSIPLSSSLSFPPGVHPRQLALTTRPRSRSAICCVTHQESKWRRSPLTTPPPRSTALSGNKRRDLCARSANSLGNLHIIDNEF